MLTEELHALGLHDAEQDAHGIVMATIPATGRQECPIIAWIAHLDTSPETSGRHVKPVIHHNYDGRDIALPADVSRVIRVADNPELAGLLGKTIVTSDGTTLLGADDKAGIAVVMEAAAHLLAHPEIVHGSIRLCFTCDEEIGHGVDHLDLHKLCAVVAYTLDGGAAANSMVRLSRPIWPSLPSRGSTSIHPSARVEWSMPSGLPVCSWNGCPGRRLHRNPRLTAKVFCTPIAWKAALPK